MRGTQARWLFAATVALAAALGFSVQPLVAKWVLPRYGGTPAVWTTVALFFQAALLVGYALAHLVARRLALRPAIVGQLALLALAAVQLPVALSADVPDFDAPGSIVALELLVALASTVALPAIVVLGVAPTLQRWFSGIEGAGDPYPLYAASNVGSMVGLLAYPLLIEVQLDLVQQGAAWSIAYAVLGALVVACGWAARGARVPHSAPDRRPPLKTGLRWMAWAALPAANLMVVTAHVTTDVAPIPLLWVVPMAIYLATWALAFSGWGAAVTEAAQRITPLAAMGIAPLALLSATTPVAGVMVGHLVWLGISSLAFHGALAVDRPHPRELTAFYLWLALGGVVGGAAAAIVVPALVARALDYPILLVLLLVALPRAAETMASSRRWMVALVVAAAFAGLLLLASAVEGGTLAPFAALLLVYLPSVRRPRPAALGLAALIACATLGLETRRPGVVARRSFFASYRVVEDADRQLRWLAHGRTIHGAESSLPDVAGQCLPYHHDLSPAHRVFTQQPAPLRIAVVGLGIGCMAALRPPGSTIEFIEVDPVVVELARAHFGSLRECGDACRVTVGDGRLALERDGEAFDLIVLDAFGSDAVPVHLLSFEALAAYRRRLAPGGRIAVHITNRHVDLADVVAGIGGAHGMDAVRGEYSPPEHDDHRARTVWIVLGERRELADGPDLSWRPIDGGRVWTDRYAPIWSAL